MRRSSSLGGSPSSLPPSGAAGGQLSGTYPNPSTQQIDNQKSWVPRCPLAPSVPLNGTLFAVYLGYFPVPIAVTLAVWRAASAGTGGQTAEVGIASTPVGPNAAGQTLTKIAAQTMVSNNAVIGFKTETVAWTLSGHVWTMVRQAFGTTNAAMTNAFEVGIGDCLSIAAAGDLNAFVSGAAVTATTLAHSCFGVVR